MYLLLFFISILLVCQSNSILMIWLGLELNTLIFLFFVKMKSETNFFPEFWVKYFLIQSMLSFLILFSILNFSFSAWFISINIIMKMGVPPFHFWIQDMLKMLNPKQFFFLSIFQKIPFLFLFFLFGLPFILMFMFLGFNIFSVLFTMLESSFIGFMFFSSLNLSMEFLFSLKTNFQNFIIWFFFYAIFFYFIMNKTEKMLNPSNMNISMKGVWVGFMLMSGLPPFNFFFMKIFIISSLIKYSVFIVFLYLSFSFVFMFFYFRFFLLIMNQKFQKVNFETISFFTLLFFLFSWVWNVFLV